MCAAPGSKTAQLIELLHSDENNPVPGEYWKVFINNNADVVIVIKHVFLRINICCTPRVMLKPEPEPMGLADVSVPENHV